MELRERAAHESPKKTSPPPTTPTTPMESVAAESQERRRNWARRTWTTLVMIAIFFSVVYLGHWACVVLIFGLEATMFHEMDKIRKMGLKAKHEVPITSLWVDWGLFITASYLIIGRALNSNFAEQFLRTPLGDFHVRYQVLIGFLMYCAVFVVFVCTLQQGKYKQQFIQFAWAHMVLISVILQANLWIHNVFKGLFWLLLPASLVISNDIWAFIVGSLIGRTPLISLSKKKTWEGWLGGAIASLIWAFFFSAILAQYPWLTCPKLDAATWDVVPCDIPRVFTLQQYHLPFTAVIFTIYPVQLHSLVLALFASIVAPFGGFFASGLKRAFGIKDFNNLIPGHGGITDRMDCQFLMGTFSNIYITTFVLKSTISSVMGKLVTMDTEAQVSVFNKLHDLLVAKGAL